MTPERAFKSGGRNPNSGLWAGEWYAVGCVFFPQVVEDGGKQFFGFRMLTCMDVASTFLLGHQLLLRDPEALRSGEVIEFAERILDKFPSRLKGMVSSHSCWLSSLELVMDDETEEQGRFLEASGLSFGPMADGDKAELVAWGTGRGLAILFDGDQISPSGACD